MCNTGQITAPSGHAHNPNVPFATGIKPLIRCNADRERFLEGAITDGITSLFPLCRDK
jgi:hypothetical protein